MFLRGRGEWPLIIAFKVSNDWNAQLALMPARATVLAVLRKERLEEARLDDVLAVLKKDRLEEARLESNKSWCFCFR